MTKGVHPDPARLAAQEPHTGAEPSAAFTPGPWSVLDCRDMCDELWIEAKHPEVDEVSHAAVRFGCDEAAELGDLFANARLIAAAPELFEALNKRPIVSKFHMKDGFDGGGFFAAYEAFSEAARAALRKALGEQA